MKRFISASSINIVTPLCSPETLCDLKHGEFTRDIEYQVSLVAGKRLRAEHAAVWRAMHQSNPELANPCFAPEFIQSVAEVRNDVEVAIIRQNGAIKAFFPFQRAGRARGIPAGGIVSDYQGLICRPGFSCDPRQLLKDCGLVAWDFDRLLTSQSCFRPYYKLCEPSAQIDLSEGYAAYAEERRTRGTHQLRDCEYMVRRLERDLGPIRFVPHCTDPNSLFKVLAWKSRQYRKSGWNDLFATTWGRALIERIHSFQKPDFGGMLSLLYVGGKLIAGHMGMRSRTVWHYWFPAYDPAFAKYSPGLILLVKMAQHAEDYGLHSIDLGTGISLYKKRLMNCCVDVAEGSVERASCLHVIRSSRRALRSLVRGFTPRSRR